MNTTKSDHVRMLSYLLEQEIKKLLRAAVDSGFSGFELLSIVEEVLEDHANEIEPSTFADSDSEEVLIHNFLTYQNKLIGVLVKNLDYNPSFFTGKSELEKAIMQDINEIQD